MPIILNNVSKDAKYIRSNLYVMIPEDGSKIALTEIRKQALNKRISSASLVKYLSELEEDKLIVREEDKRHYRVSYYRSKLKALDKQIRLNLSMLKRLGSIFEKARDVDKKDKIITYFVDFILFNIISSTVKVFDITSSENMSRAFDTMFRVEVAPYLEAISKTPLAREFMLALNQRSMFEMEQVLEAGIELRMKGITYESLGRSK